MQNKIFNFIDRPLILILIGASYGIPLTSWPAFIALLIALYAAVLNRIDTKTISWFFALIIIGAVLITRYSINLPSIEMGEQIYSPDDKILNNILPESIRKDAKEDIEKLELPFEIPPANIEKNTNPWAFSADSFFTNPKMTRIIYSLDFKDRYDLRVGKLNDARYNFFGTDNKTNLIYGKWGAYYPLIFSFLLPQSMHSSKMCWTGKFYLKDNNKWNKFYAEEEKCIYLKREFWKNKKNLQIYAFDFNRNLPLSLSIKNHKNTLLYLLSIFSSISILLLLTRLNKSDFLILSIFTLSIVIFIVSQQQNGYPAGFSELPYMSRGNDGLTHYSFAREMSETLSKGNLIEWLRGRENIFYYMPGMRYAWAMTMPIFGESVLGLLLFVSLAPLAIRNILKKLTNDTWYKILLMTFLFIPILEAFGFFQLYLIKYTFLGFGAGIAITSLIISVNLFWQKDDYEHKIFELILIGLLFAFAISLRPNFAISIFILLLGISFYFFHTKQNIKKLFYFGLGFSPFLLIPIHNYHFGKILVPITASATIKNNMPNHPDIWIDCFNSSEIACSRIIDHIGIWISYKEPWYILIFLLLWIIIFHKNSSYFEKILATSMIAGHLQFLFYEGVARYSHGIWLISFLTCIPIICNTVWPRIDKVYKLIKNYKYYN